MVVKGFLGVPAFDVLTLGLSCRQLAVEVDCAFMELPPFHVCVCDDKVHSEDVHVKAVGDEEALDITCDGLVITLKPDKWTYTVAERY